MLNFKSLLTASFIASSFITTAAQAGPFGFNTTSMENPKDKYEYCDDYKINTRFVSCTNAPKPHPDIDYYIIYFSKDIGICSIEGITKYVIDLENDAEIVLKIDELTDYFRAKYKGGELLTIGSNDYMVETRGPSGDGDFRGYEWRMYNNPIDGIVKISIIILKDYENENRGPIRVNFDTISYPHCVAALHRR